MSDYRQQIIRAMEESLISVFDADSVEVISRKLTTVLSEYEVVKRCTDVVVYDDDNDRMIKRYCACLVVDGKSKNTIYAYQCTLRRFSEFIGKKLTEISAYDIRYYLACCKENGLENSTIENARSNLSAFFQWMADEEIIAKNPCASIKPIKCPDKERFPFTSVELDALRHACNRPKERAIIELLVSSGIRVAELANMDVTDIDFHERTVHVRNGKGGKDRTTYMSDVAKVHLQKYLSTRKDDNVALISNKNYQRICTGGIRRVLNAVAKRANVSNVHPHRFRRTFATSMARRGMPVQEIQKLLGHTSLQTTMKYVCVDDTKVKASYGQYIA